jgi:hypothetical protein
MQPVSSLSFVGRRSRLAADLVYCWRGAREEFLRNPTWEIRHPLPASKPSANPRSASSSIFSPESVMSLVQGFTDRNIHAVTSR